jgi:hypothetical protein
MMGTQAPLETYEQRVNKQMLAEVIRHREGAFPVH